jgi:hypothetical protein
MRITSSLAICLLICAQAAFAAPPCPSNLLTNGSFENGNTSWIITGGTSQESTDARDGTKAIKLCPNISLMRMYQYVNATPGTQYTFSAWVKMDVNQTTYPTMFVKYMAADWSVLDTKFKAMQVFSAYTEYSITSTAPVGTVRIELGFFHNGVCQIIDDACLRTGATPATCVLTATASEIVCLDNSTPNITTDDRWQCRLTVVPSGTGCINQTSSVWYGTPTSLGNYNTPSLVSNSLLISDGAVTFQFVDAQNQSITGSLLVQPPAVCSSPPSTICANNLASNGGFEFNLNDWAMVGTTVSTTASSGTKSASICNNQSLRQTKPAAWGQGHTLTFKGRSSAAGAKVLAYVKYLNSNWSPLLTEFIDAAPGTTAFSTYSVSAIAPTLTAYIEIGFFNFNTGCVLIDEVCLENNPCASDLIKPTITCPANITVQSTNNTNAIATWTVPVATDNCPGPVTVSGTYSSGQTFAVGATNISYTARDAAQNSTQCAFSVTVQGQAGGNQCNFTRAYAMPGELSAVASVNIFVTSSTGYTLRSNERLGGDSIRFAEMKIDLTGNLVSTTGSSFKPLGAHTWLADGNIIEAQATNLNTIVIYKRSAQGALLWTKQIAVTPPNYQPWPASNTVLGNVVETSTGKLYFFGMFLHDRPSLTSYSSFLLETDANGNQLQFKEYPGNLRFTSELTGIIKLENGSLYLTALLNNERIGYSKLNSNLERNFSFVPSILNRFYQSSIVESTNGLNAIGTEADDFNVYVKLFDISNNQILSTKTYAGVSAPTGTSDGGFAFITTTNGQRELLKLNQNLDFVWSKPLNNGFTYNSMRELSTGGFLISGRVQGQWVIMRTDNQGNVLPDCNGATTFTDLTVQNASFVATSMARGTSSQVKFDVRNLTNAPAPTSKVEFFLTDSLTILNLKVGEIMLPAIPANGQLLQQTGTITIEPNWYLGFLPKEFKLIVRIDADQIIQEVSETNNHTVSLGRILVSDAPAAGSDLSLTLIANRTTVPQWSTVTASITVTNQSQASIASATIQFGLCSNQGKFEFTGTNKLVFGGTPVAPAGSTLNQITQEWEITNLAAGQSTTLQLPLFTLAAQTYRLMAWTTAQSPADPDSQPSASPLALSTGTCTLSQDDEATLSFGPILQLQSSNPNTIQVPEVESVALLYPNPATEYIILNLSDYATDVHIEVIDGAGLARKSLTDTDPQSELRLRQIPVHDLSPGLYFVRLRSAGVREKVLRFVVVGM